MVRLIPAIEIVNATDYPCNSATVHDRVVIGRRKRATTAERVVKIFYPRKESFELDPKNETAG
jgi:hypothetical protein